MDEKERERYHQLMEVIGWFFFDLFILGYVEDPNTGKSFRMPGGLKWAVYIEVQRHPTTCTHTLKQKIFAETPFAIFMLAWFCTCTCTCTCMYTHVHCTCSMHTHAII